MRFQMEKIHSDSHISVDRYYSILVGSLLVIGITSVRRTLACLSETSLSRAIIFQYALNGKRILKR